MRCAPFPFKSALECTFSTFPLRQPFHQLNATLPPKLAILLEPVKPTYYRRIKNTSLTEDQAKFTLSKNYPIIIQLPRPSFLEVKYLNLAIWNTVVLNEMLTQWYFSLILARAFLISNLLPCVPIRPVFTCPTKVCCESVRTISA